MSSEARDAFQLAMKYDPINAYLENNLGLSKLLLGELNEGAMHIAKAAQLEPNVPAFLHNVNLLAQAAETGHWPQSRLVPELYYTRGM